jgi:hypothetical protein
MKLETWVCPMDRNVELAHLAIAEKALADGERHILLQEERVAELDRDGHDTKRALATLAIFKNQAKHVAHRDLKILQQDAARPHFAPGPIFRPGHYEDGKTSRMASLLKVARIEPLAHLLTELLP